MADKGAQVRDFLLSEVAKRRSWRTSTGRPIGSTIARDLGVSQSTASRALRAQRTMVASSDRVKPPRGYQISAEMEQAMIAYFRFSGPAELAEAIENAPHSPRRRRKKQ